MSQAGEAAPAMGPRVLLVAGDLIWASRLEGRLRTLGTEPDRVGHLAAWLGVPVPAPGSQAAPPAAPPRAVAAGRPRLEPREV